MNERENQILGIVLNKPETAYLILEKLNENDFSNDVTRGTFEAIKKLNEDDKEINTPNIKCIFESIYNGDADIFIKYINQIKYEYSVLDIEALKSRIKQTIDDRIKTEMQKAIETGTTPEEIANNIERLEEQRKRIHEQGNNKPDNMCDYIKQAFSDDIAAFQKSNTIKTGFKNFDDKTGGLFPGLYVIGAISSLGKTTFIHQMCDNVARNGNPVLFFSLEQSKLELVTKSIARMSAQQYTIENPSAKTPDYAVYCSSAINIRQHGIKKDFTKSALKEYTDTIADNMNIIEGNFNTNVEYIRDYIKRFTRNNKNKGTPVVVVDYLQIMQAPQGYKGVNKDSIDYNVTELKRISRDFNIPVFVISAFNRASYMTPVSFECFKESGGIEYTADVLIGLQLKALSEKDFTDNDNKTNAKREKLKQEKAKNPREIQLCCIKNRNGITSFDLNFKYLTVYDLFIPNEPPIMPETQTKRR